MNTEKGRREGRDLKDRYLRQCRKRGRKVGVAEDPSPGIHNRGQEGLPATRRGTGNGNTISRWGPPPAPAREGQKGV